MQKLTCPGRHKGQVDPTGPLKMEEIHLHR